jgi:hypothetical protein
MPHDFCFAMPEIVQGTPHRHASPPLRVPINHRAWSSGGVFVCSSESVSSADLKMPDMRWRADLFG